MTNKLKNQANKLRGAVNKTKAIKALDTDNSNVSASAPPGYDQVNNRDDRLISRDDDADVENQLIPDDNTLFEDLDENDPLLVMQR